MGERIDKQWATNHVSVTRVEEADKEARIWLGEFPDIDIPFKSWTSDEILVVHEPSPQHVSLMTVPVGWISCPLRARRADGGGGGGLTSWADSQLT